MSAPSPPGEPPRAGGALTPVARGGLADQVLGQLRQRIADGTWPLHHRLPVETALARDLGVGRSTIREAVRVLVHAGLLEVRQGDGTYVRSRREIDAALARRLSDARLLEAYEVRRALDVEAARLAAQRRASEDVAHLRALLDARTAAYALGPQAYLRAHLALQERIGELAGNPLLADLYRSFQEPIRVGVTSNLDDVNLALEGPESPELGLIVEAIADGDADAAAYAAARRIDNVMRVVRFSLQIMTVGPAGP